MYLTYTSRMMECRRDGYEEGISIGLEQGAYQNKLETAKAFLSEGLAPQMVARCTKLPSGCGSSTRSNQIATPPAPHLHRRGLPIAHPRNPIPQTPSCEPAIPQPDPKPHLGKLHHQATHFEEVL